MPSPTSTPPPPKLGPPPQQVKEPPLIRALAALEEAAIDKMAMSGVSAETEKAFQRYQKLKTTALRPGTPAEGQTAFKLAIVEMVKMVL